tara:strand:- start:14 stop:241 length:228 start_codon:yes stop_codon:yes gene_type:complete
MAKEIKKLNTDLNKVNIELTIIQGLQDKALKNRDMEKHTRLYNMHCVLSEKRKAIVSLIALEKDLSRAEQECFAK